MKKIVSIALLILIVFFSYTFYRDLDEPIEKSTKENRIFRALELNELTSESDIVATSKQQTKPDAIPNTMYDELSHIGKVNAFYRGYRGIAMVPEENRYANELNVEFMFEMARSGDFHAQDTLIFLLNPMVISSFYGLFDKTEDASIGNRLDYYQDIYTLDSEQIATKFQEAIMIAAAYGRTAFLVQLNAKGTVQIKNDSLIYAAYLDGDAVQVNSFETYNLLSTPAYSNEVKEKGLSLYNEIVTKREEMGLQNNIGSNEFLKSWSVDQDCPTNSQIKLSSSQCNPFVY